MNETLLLLVIGKKDAVEELLLSEDVVMKQSNRDVFLYRSMHEYGNINMGGSVKCTSFIWKIICLLSTFQQMMEL